MDAAEGGTPEEVPDATKDWAAEIGQVSHHYLQDNRLEDRVYVS